jgi:hypothetical protein
VCGGREGGEMELYISSSSSSSILAVSHFKGERGGTCVLPSIRGLGDSDISDIIYDEFRTWIALHGWS